MNTNNITKKLVVMLAVLAIGFAYKASAQTPLGVNTNVGAGVTTNTAVSSGLNTSATVNASGTVRSRRGMGMMGMGLRASSTRGISTENIAQVQAKADGAITARIDALNKLSTRVNAMVKVSASTKSSLQSNVQTEISNLTTLKAKIDADTDHTVLKTDLKSITGGFRIYALVIPQGSILAAGDRASTIVDDMNAIGAKIQARISAAQAAGDNVSSLQTTYTDFTTKVSNANTEATAAISGTASLTPDNGNQATLTANNQALQTAKADIKTATEDLQAARADLTTLVKGVEALHVSATSSASVSATQ